MDGKIRGHIRSNVIGYLALFVALSGTAYAIDGPLAGQNTVGSEDIINGEVLTRDLANDSVNTAKLVNETVRSADVQNDNLTGADINEGTLSGVNAGLLDGLDSSAFPRTFVHGNNSFAPGIGNRLELNATLGALLVVNCDNAATPSTDPGGDADDTVSIGVVNVGPNPLQVFVERVGSTTGNTVDDHEVQRLELPQNNSTGSVLSKNAAYRFYISPLGDTSTAITAHAAASVIGGSDNCAGLIQASRSN
jgi:hypothetical protein